MRGSRGVLSSVYIVVGTARSPRAFFRLSSFVFYSLLPGATLPLRPAAAARRAGESMVTIGMNYFVHPGKEQVFENAFRSVQRALEQAEGHEASTLYRAVDGEEATEYLIVSRWTSEEAFRAFLASDEFKKVTSWGLKHILAGPPRHTTYGSS